MEKNIANLIDRDMPSIGSITQTAVDSTRMWGDGDRIGAVKNSMDSPKISNNRSYIGRLVSGISNFYKDLRKGFEEYDF